MFPAGDQVLEAHKPDEDSRLSRRARNGHDSAVPAGVSRQHRSTAPAMLDARIELHQRFALPLACVLMALIGVPLGITARRAGKSAAVVLTVAIAFLYYMAMISFISMARQGTLPPGIAVWLPDVLCSPRHHS